MLVYANGFTLQPANGISDVIEQVSSWLSAVRKTNVDSARLGAGIKEFRLSDGATLSSLSTATSQGEQIFPYSFCARLTHGQNNVPGRRWITEIGIRQDSPDQQIFCSILLKTDEISARVNDPIQVTRPRVVERIIQHCKPHLDTPGLSIINLTESNATAFAYEIERESRRYPFVEISCDRDGNFPVQPSRLQSILIGLAQVIEIPPGENTYRIEEKLGRKYSAFGGAINIIYPYRPTESGGFCKSILLKPDYMAALLEAGQTIESEVLSAVTHQTNLPNSWRHISIETVREATLRLKLQSAIFAASGVQNVEVYEELLQDAAAQLEAKNREIADARLDVEARDANVERLSSENDGLKHIIASFDSKSSSAISSPEISEDISLAFRAAISGNPTLQQALAVIAYLYGDRVVVLDSAYSAARDSDRGGFIHGRKALELLRLLAERYWTDLSEGNGDQVARAVFGNSFSAKEAELSKDGRKRRTFKYKEAEYFMEKHLKIGVKDSYAETLRVHFDWLPEDKVIIIGHCGKHINF